MIFDKIIIITMEKNKDRQEYCKNLMKKLGWEFEFFYAKPHKMVERGDVINHIC